MYVDGVRQGPKNPNIFSTDIKPLGGNDEARKLIKIPDMPGGAVTNVAFNLMVPTLEQQANTVTDNMQAIIGNYAGADLADTVEDGVSKLDDATSELDKNQPDTEAAVGNIEGAIAEIQAAVESGDMDLPTGTEIHDELTGIASTSSEII